MSQGEAHHKQVMCPQEEDNIMKKMCVTRNMSLGEGEFASPRKKNTHLSCMPIVVDYSSCMDMFLKLSLQNIIIVVTYNGFLGMFLKISCQSFIIV